ERVDEAAIGQPRPAPRLDGAARSQRELVEAALPGARVDAPLAREPPQRAVRADVVEAVIVDARVRDMRRHALDRALAAELEEFNLAGGVELQQRRSELKALRPLGPPARLIASADREHRRALLGTPAVLDRSNLRGGEIEEAADSR